MPPPMLMIKKLRHRSLLVIALCVLTYWLAEECCNEEGCLLEWGGGAQNVGVLAILNL